MSSILTKYISCGFVGLYVINLNLERLNYHIINFWTISIIILEYDGLFMNGSFFIGLRFILKSYDG